MPEERIEVGVLARDVAVQVSTQVANTVAAAKTNELLDASASAEASRVSAEQGRVTAEQGRVTAEQGRVAAETARATEFAGFEDEIAENNNLAHVVSDELTDFETWEEYADANFYNPDAWTTDNVVNGKCYIHGEEVSVQNSAHTGFFELPPNETFTIGLVPAYGSATLPSWQLGVIITFFDADYNYVGEALRENPTFTTPKGTKYAVVNLMYGTGGIDFSIANGRCVIYKGSSLPSSFKRYIPVLKTKEKINELDEQVDVYNEKLYTYQGIDGLEYTSGTCWSANINNFYGADWSYTIIDLSHYDIKALSARSVTNSACPAIVFFNGDPLNGGTYISYMLRGSSQDTSEVVSADDIEIPVGCTHVLFQYKNGYSSQAYILGKQFMNLAPSGSVALPIYVTWDKTNSKLTANTRFNATKDLCVEMGKRGPNSIFDFKKWSFNNNNGHYPLAVDSGPTYASNGTDFFGPWIISSVNNKDGDNAGSGNFTGGNHGYDNTGSTTNNSATGRTVSVEVRIDGNLCDEFEGYCSRIDIYWVNRIQAFTTTKIDGTGREVLEERYHMSFDGHTWEVEGNPIALEDIKVLSYYGLQFAAFGANTSSNKIEYYGDDTDSTYGSDENSSATSKNCLGMVYKDVANGFKCTIFVDNTKGLGRGSLNVDNAYSFFYQNYGKGYGNLIKNSGGASIEGGKSMYFKGSYVFEPILI